MYATEEEQYSPHDQYCGYTYFLEAKVHSILLVDTKDKTILQKPVNIHCGLHISTIEVPY